MKLAVAQAPLCVFPSSGNVTERKTATTERTRSTVVGGNGSHTIKDDLLLIRLGQSVVCGLWMDGHRKHTSGIFTAN